jgi:hypothetical protein
VVRIAWWTVPVSSGSGEARMQCSLERPRVALDPALKEIVLPHAETAQTTSDGFRLSPSLMDSIGISNRSQCWGLELPCPQGVEDIGGGLPHLLVSAIHPDSWPVAVRLQLRLAERPGVLARATEVVASCGFGVLPSESTPTGHRHSTWNPLCQFLPLKEYAKAAYPSGQASQSERFTIGERLGTLMLGASEYLRRSILTADRDDRNTKGAGFLSDRLLTPSTDADVPQLFLAGVTPALVEDVFTNDLTAEWPAEHLSDKHQQILAMISNYFVGDYLSADRRQSAVAALSRDPEDWAVSVRYLAGLSFNWFMSSESRNPIGFEYDEVEQLLRPNNSSLQSFAAILRKIHHCPRDLLATYDISAQYLRLVFAAGMRAPTAVLSLRYSAFVAHGSELRGFLNRLCVHMAPHANLVRVTTRLHAVYPSKSMTGVAGDEERGEIRLYATAIRSGGNVREDEQRLLQTLEEFAVRERSEHMKLESGSAPFGRRRLFLSTRFGETQDARFQTWHSKVVPRIKDIIRENGFEPIVADSAGGHQPVVITDVAEAISSCHAMLQVVPDGGDGPESTSWLSAELLAGLACHLRIRVMVEARVEAKLGAWVKGSAGIRAIPFGMTWGDDERFYRQCGEAVRELLREVLEAGQGRAEAPALAT